MSEQSNPETTDEMEPMLLERILGQPQVISNLQMHLAAYWHDRAAGKAPSFGPVGLFGPPGVGKTMLAHSIHHELGNFKFIEIIGENLGLTSLYETLMAVENENSTMFIDEAQGLPRAAQHVLLKVLAENKLCVPKGKYGKREYQIPLPRFVIIIASTHEFVLQAALRSRLKIYTRMGYYSIEDLAKIIQQRADIHKWKYDSSDIFVHIAQRSKRTPRLGIRHLETCYHVARSQDAQIITQDHVRQAFELSEVDELGLDHLEQNYLKLLEEANLLPLNVIASRLGLPAKTIQDVVEPYLIQEGLISKDRAQRVITDLGLKHLKGST